MVINHLQVMGWSSKWDPKIGETQTPNIFLRVGEVFHPWKLHQVNLEKETQTTRFFKSWPRLEPFSSDLFRAEVTWPKPFGEPKYVTLKNLEGTKMVN